MNDDTIYRRETTPSGRVRYVPAGRYWDPGIWPEGAHLVIIGAGLHAYRYRIDPDRAAVQAAIGEHREEVARVLVARTRSGAWSVSDLIDTLISEVERLTAPADDGRCVEGGAWCAAVEPAHHRPTYSINICGRTGWGRAGRVEPCDGLLLPPSWGPSTTATPTCGRCGEA